MPRFKLNSRIGTYGLVILYLIFIGTSFLAKSEPGTKIGENFMVFLVGMMKVLPCAFVLIGLFEVWVKKEKVEKHLGENSGIRGYLWALILASSTVGGLYVAFPVAHSLHKKGARLSVIFTYIGAAGICRIPMTIFEASFMGLKFSLIRLVVSVPLLIISSIWMEKILKSKNFQIQDGS